MIRANKSPHFSSQCQSSDQLTPTERAASHDDHFADADKLVYRDRAMTWGEHPEIRAILSLVRTTP